mgnify:CR=1 FL=1
MSASFFKKQFLSAVLPLPALALSAGLAAAHPGGHGEDVSFNPTDICDNPTDLHQPISACYQTYAENMQVYAEQTASRYLAAPTLADLVALLEQEEPTELAIDEARNAVIARWGLRLSEDEFVHDRYEGPALKSVVLGTSYLETFMRDNEPFRENNLPTTLLYQPDIRIGMMTENAAGRHNEHGPAEAVLQTPIDQLELFWLLNDDPHSVNGSPTYARITVTSGVARYQEYQSGRGMALQRAHRHDCLYQIEHDEQGRRVSALYHTHDRDMETDDEIEIRVIYDPDTQEILERHWTDNGMPITEEEGIARTYAFTPGHYCDLPQEVHPGPGVEQGN